MDRDTSEDAKLEAFFKAAKDNPPEPSSDFISKLQMDALAAVPKATKAAKPRSGPQLSPFTRLKGLFAASGLSGVAALGLWIGFVMPDLIATLTPVSDDVTNISAFLASADLSGLNE